MTLCLHCDEPVEPHEQSPSFQSQPMHHACGFRMIVGSVAHVERRCSCYVPGSAEDDPPGMTLRQAAEAALAAFRRINCCKFCGAFLQGGATLHQAWCPIYPLTYQAFMLAQKAMVN